MKLRFVYEWIESDNTYAVFNEEFKPIIEISKYIKTLKSKNSKEGVAIALMLWFDYLDQIGLHYSNVETKHIPMWRDWLKTPVKYRDVENTYMLYQEPHIADSTWMQYQSRLSSFYERYVLVNYPDCKISFKENVSYNPNAKFTSLERLKFRVKIKVTKPDARALSIETIRAILDRCTNKRDRLFIELMYICGIRRGELFNIDYEQFVNIPRGEEYPLFIAYIHDSISGDKDKQTKTGAREIYIPTSLAERISAYVCDTIDGRVVNANKHEELITAMRDSKHSKKGDTISAKTFSLIFKRAAKKAGFQEATLHDLRHSFVTNQLSMGVGAIDVMEQTGHLSIQTLDGYRTKAYGKISDDVIFAHREIYSKLRN